MANEDPETGEYRSRHRDGGRDAGRRWTDPNNMVAILGGLILLMMAWWNSQVYSMAHTSELKNAEQDAIILTIVKNQAELGAKIDRLLEKVK